MPDLLRLVHRLNSAYPWDHNARLHPWILRQLPARPRSALDVGCGAGDLARRLAVRAREVHGIDSDPAIVELARRRTRAGAPIEYTVGDAVTGLPPGPHDAITCVAVLHHLPQAAALTALRERLAPGGTLVVVGLAQPSWDLTDRLLELASLLLNPVVGILKNGGRPSPRPPAMRARTKPAEVRYADLVREAQRLLPGARLRRRLFWRYTLVWRAPGGA
ncbi:class I SAM-dependent methyltransferase [Kitasatospora viridis]|uniref:Methyltransferase family protein n=1 Tax=Kitasatospora viridis TaxID=281105 RepID=A0A561ULR7_9ACTN|nr:class I SAM-dependent methyltransferase [Kitasatospora viridis]TWG00295.1 methyltransferase family protein [Kitasatospora viridis]